MLEALAEGRIGHLALDVFHSEPLDPNSPVLKSPNVTLTPHSGWITADAVDRLLKFGFSALARNIVSQPADL